MAIPQLNENGNLPEGVHTCSESEIEERFGSFQRSDVRCRIFERLADYLTELRATDAVSFVIVDGSFTTAKDEPGDIDLIVIFKSGHDFEADLPPFAYNALSKRSVRRTFGFDVLLAEEGNPEYDDYVSFFARVRGEPNQFKGMLRIDL